MNKEQLIERYRDAAIRHRDGTGYGGYKKTNRAHDEIVELLGVLRNRSDSGETILRDLIALGDDRVTGWAALHMLPIDPDFARKELQRIASETGSSS